MTKEHYLELLTFAPAMTKEDILLLERFEPLLPLLAVAVSLAFPMMRWA